MNSYQIITALAFAIYLGLMLSIGFVTYKKTKSTSDYFLGGRSIGPWFTALSAEASDMSGWLLMGLPGLAYFSGLQEAFWTAVGLLVGTYLNWLLVAKRMRKYTIHAKDSITIPEFLTNRFHDKSKALQTISSIIILMFFIVYTASGFLASAKLFTAVFGLNYYIALLLGVAVILGYTLLGGYLAVVATDFLQGSLMFIALIATGFIALILAGGPAHTFNELAQFGRHFINPFITPPGTSYGFLQILSALAWGLGYFGMPHILVRFMSIRSNAEVKTSRRIAMVWVSLAMAAALLVGVVGKVFLVPLVYESQSAAEAVFIASMQKIFPTFIAGFFLCAILAASMSTADSQLLVASSAFSKDVYKALLRKDASDKETLLVSRITVVTITIIAIFLAMDPNSSIFDVVSYAWAGFGATFGPVILASLFWRRASRNGAIAAMVSGGLTVVIWKQLSGGLFDVYELLPGFIIASIFMVIFSLLEKHPDPKMFEEFDAYMAIED
ncbi:MAG: sodium/proline symporter PutP [Sphaerochaeta sp.]|jgi:sodium/proline symporter|uniref:sodium/proline symporter PutP n=1 Tax=Sphaerochaeta sp. TaxID=1972642 RepID=UPI002FCBD989